jgi:hypothetical protein
MINPATRTSTHWLPRLLQVWALVSLLTFGTMLTHQSDSPILFGRYSALVVCMLVGLLLLALIAWVCSLWLSQQPTRLLKLDQQLETWRSQPWYTPVLFGVAGVTLAILWIFFLGNHLPTYGFLRAFLGLSIIIGTLALVKGGSIFVAPSKLGILPWLGIALLVTIALLTTPFYPNVMKTDEAFVFSMAQNVLENGHFRPLIYAQAYPEYYYGGIWTWMMAVWMKIVGISVESARLYNLVLAYLSLAAIWAAVARLFDRLTAWYAALIGAYAFMALNHIRFDIHAAFWLSLGILFFSLSRPAQWWMYLLTGFSVGLSVDSNPIAYCFSLGLIVYYGWEYLRLIRQQRRWLWFPFWLVLSGVLCAIGLYLITHSGQSFPDGQNSGGMLTQYVSFIRESLSTGHYVQQIRQYLTVFLTSQPILFGLTLVGIIVALREGTRGDKILIAMYFAWTFVIIFAYHYFPLFYLLLASPIFIPLAARGFSQGVASLLRIEANHIAQTSILLLLVWLVVSVVYEIRDGSSQSVEDVIETGRQISQILPRDMVIIGAEPYYFGMLDHTHFVAGAIESTMIIQRNLSPDEVWPVIAPDAVIFSEGWPTEPSRTPALMSYMDEQQFFLLSCYQTNSFGRVELWTKTIPPDVTPSSECIRVCNPRTGCS